MFFEGILSGLAKIVFFVSFLWVILFGGFQIGAIDPSQNCPIAGHSMAICQMNPTEHIQEWQSAFTMVPAQAVILMLLAFFVTLKLSFFFKLLLPDPTLLHLQKFGAGLSNFKLFDPIQEAFSNGILNPKTF